MEDKNKVSKLRSRYNKLVETMKEWNLYYEDDDVGYALQKLSEEISKIDCKLEDDEYFA